MRSNVNTYSVFLSSLTVMLFLVMVSALAQPTQDNLLHQTPTAVTTRSGSSVRNPSFEQQDSAGFAQNWQFRPNLTSLDDTASDGQWSLRVATSEPSDAYSRQSSLELMPNTRYTVRVRVKTEAVRGSGAGFRLLVGDARVESERLRGDHDWRVLEESFITPATFDDSYLDLIWNVESGVIWYDQLELFVDTGIFNRNQANLARESFNVSDVPVRPLDNVPIGVFQAGAHLGGIAGFDLMVTRLQAAGMDSAILIERSQSQALFDSADEANFKLILMPIFELDRSWWPDEFPATLAQAQRAASAIIDNVRGHSSLFAYALTDEPSNQQAEKVCLLTDTFRDLDASTPVTGVFIGLNRGDLIFRDCQPDILLIDLYPFKEESALGDFSMRGFGYNNLDYVDYIRRFTRFKTPEQPLWVLLQTHKTDWPNYKLREPTPAELRAMNWLALGEGASGFFYFHWTSAQTWRGLADNPDLLAEVGHFSRRVRALETLLLSWHKTDDAFFVADTSRNDDNDQFAYTSTLSTAQVVPPEGELSAQVQREDMYVLLVNRDVTNTRTFTLEMLPTLGTPDSVELLNAESGALQTLTDPITLAPGDAALFQVFFAGLEQTIARHNPENPVDTRDVDARDVDTANVETVNDTTSEAPDNTAASDAANPTATDTTTVEAESDTAENSNQDASEAAVDTSTDTSTDTVSDTTEQVPETSSGASSETVPEATSNREETPNEADEATSDTAEEAVVTAETNVAETNVAASMVTETASNDEVNNDDTLLADMAMNNVVDNSITSTVRESTTTAATLVELPADGRRAKTIENGSVPYYPIDWNLPVDVWWDGHPLNPANGGFDASEVVHPQPRVNVCDYQQGSQTGGILEALNDLPIAGGTLWLPAACGPYVIRTPLEWLQDRYSHQGQINILRRSNVHFLSDGARIISQPSVQREGDESTLLNFKSMEIQDGNREGNPERNIYFENLTFDGNNQLHQALSFDGVRDVYIYNVRFEDFILTRDKHPGAIRAAIQSDNLWCIRCAFHNASQGIYIDGSHNSGVIESTFTGSYRMAVLLLTNDDTALFSERQRSAQYFVIANNTFDYRNGAVIQMAAANTLVTNNIVRGSHSFFVGLDGKWSGVLRDGLIYDYYGNVIRSNTIEGSLEFFLEVSGWNEGDYRRYNIGDITVADNSATDVRTILNLRPRFDEALIDGIRVHNNRFTGVRNIQRKDGLGTVLNVDFIDNTIEYNE